MESYDQEKIKKRISFKEYDPTKVAYVEYEIYKEVPACDDFIYGEVRRIVLRNKYTQELEEIEYRLSGGLSLNVENPSMRIRYWGRIIPECGMNLLFDFHIDGALKSIVANYSAPELTHEQYEELQKKAEAAGARCAAAEAAFFF